jgi:hypothetical protein
MCGTRGSSPRSARSTFRGTHRWLYCGTETYGWCSRGCTLPCKLSDFCFWTVCVCVCATLALAGCCRTPQPDSCFSQALQSYLRLPAAAPLQHTISLLTISVCIVTLRPFQRIPVAMVWGHGGLGNRRRLPWQTPLLKIVSDDCSSTGTAALATIGHRSDSQATHCGGGTRWSE